MTAPPPSPYPNLFRFGIVAEAGADLDAVLTCTLAPYAVREAPRESRRSRNGRYRSYQVAVWLESRQELEALTLALRRIPGVRMLL